MCSNWQTDWCGSCRLKRNDIRDTREDCNSYCQRVSGILGSGVWGLGSGVLGLGSLGSLDSGSGAERA